MNACFSGEGERKPSHLVALLRGVGLSCDQEAERRRNKASLLSNKAQSDELFV